MINTIVHDSFKEGPVFLVFGAIHGNEKSGTKAIFDIDDLLKNGNLVLLRGKVIFVPICNPKAYELDKREIEENLNRVFCYHEHPTSYEQSLANELVPLLKEADYLLDLHSFHHPGESMIFQDYDTPELDAFSAVQPASYLIKGWPEIYAEDTSVSTEKYAYTQGVKALTLEAGYHKDEKSVETAKEAVLSSLAFLRMIAPLEKKEKTSPKKLKMTSVIYKEKEGGFVKDFQNITYMKKDELIAKDESGKAYTMPFDGYLIMPNAHAPIGDEWYYLGKEV